MRDLWEMNRHLKREGAAPRGFTLLEMMIVVAILAILMGIAVMAYQQFIPYMRVRADAKTVAAMMQRARLTAANTQRPVRLLIDCTEGAREDNDDRCVLRMQAAVYEKRTIDGGRTFLGISRWQNVVAGGESMRDFVRARYAREPNRGRMNLYAQYTRMFDFSTQDTPLYYGVWEKDTSGINDQDLADRSLASFVAIYLPSGQVITSASPYSILFYYNRHPGPDQLAWRLDVNNSTGLVRLTRTAETN